MRVVGVRFSVPCPPPPPRQLGLCAHPSSLMSLKLSGHFHSCAFSQDVSVHIPV